MGIKITHKEKVTINRYKYFDLDEDFIKKEFGSIDVVKNFFDDEFQNSENEIKFSHYLIGTHVDNFEDIVVNIEGENIIEGFSTPKDDKIEEMKWSKELNKYVKNKIN